MFNREHYNLLANLFRYPDEKYFDNVIKCKEMLLEKYPDIYIDTMPFFEFVIKEDVDKVEETFSMTFHIQAICFLDLGYVLFAEDYKRGDFLVKVKAEQEKIGNDCGNELADNLPNVLTLMAKLSDVVFLEEFSVRIVKPALEKMLHEFDMARMALKDKVRFKKQKVLLSVDEKNRNIYQHAIYAVLKVIQQDFQGAWYNDPIIKPTPGNFCDTGCETSSKLQTLKK